MRSLRSCIASDATRSIGSDERSLPHWRRACVVGGAFLVLAALSASQVEAFDLPRVIGEMRLDPYALDFTCLHDQNHDGKDDLSVRVYPSEVHSIFYGREELSHQADFSLDPVPQGMESAQYIVYVGELSDQHSNTFIAHNKIEGRIGYLVYYSIINAENHQPFFMSYNSDSLINGKCWLGFGCSSHPFDFNGDGYHDVFFGRNTTRHSGKTEILYGGENFDTIPDWTKTWPNFAICPFSAGFDVNQDGFDDLLYRFNISNSEVSYNLFFGGADPDTIPALTFSDTSFHIENGDIIMQDGFSLLKDVNDDGYDDFAIYAQYRYEDFQIDSRVYLFYGGDDIDAEPDLILEGHRGIKGDYGNIAGGDFNGDGIGDIAVSFWAPIPYTWGEIQIHLGNRWIDETADIYIPETAYNGQYDMIGHIIGAVGDYNGDDIDDLVSSAAGEIDVVVFAGNRDWQLHAEEPVLPIHIDFQLYSSPNPFNQSTQIKCQFARPGRYTLTIYDINGRAITKLFNGNIEENGLIVKFEASSPGLYFARLSEENGGSRIIKLLFLP